MYALTRLVRFGGLATLSRRERGCALPPILKRHLERDLDRGGAVVGKEDVIQAAGRDFDQSAGELDRRRMGHTKKRDMSDLVELLANGRVDLRMSMAMHVAPQAADAVDISTPLHVDQRAALGPLDEQRLVLGHLRERVPDVVAI